MLSSSNSYRMTDVNMYSAALMKKTNQDLDASYYQIAGIHGQPYIAWQGAGGEPATPNEGQ